MSYRGLKVPRTGLEPARLAALAPETSASTIPPPGLCDCKFKAFFLIIQIFLLSRSRETRFFILNFAGLSQMFVVLLVLLLWV